MVCPRPLALLSALTVFAVWPVVLAAGAESYDLRPKLPDGSLTQVDVVLQLGGEVKLAASGKQTALPMSVVANIHYDERLLTDAAPAEPLRRSLRYYDKANVVIKIDKGGQKPALRESRRLISSQAGRGSVTLFSPSGPLAPTSWTCLKYRQTA